MLENRSSKPVILIEIYFIKTVVGFKETDDIRIYPPDSKPYGTTYIEWAENWWRWILSIPKSKNPAVNLAEVFPLEDQPYSRIVFLCQTMEGNPVNPRRVLAHHAGYSLFMPIINWLSVLKVDGTTERELVLKAKEKIDAVSKIEVTIGDIVVKNLETFRFVSPMFEIVLPLENILDLPPGTIKAVSDGYWIFIGPIYRQITIGTYGSCSLGITQIGVSYTLSTI